MFFGDSGSIAGGTMLTPPSSPAGTYCCMCQTLASYSSISGSRRASVAGFGVERSMWQRQIQRLARSGALRRIAAGWGSWMMIASQSLSSPRAFIAL